MVACNYVTDSHVWLHLKVGQLIAKQSAPVTTDVFSYTQAGQPWYNIPWLFQWFHAVLYDFVYGMVPVDAIDPTANREKAEQIAVGTLVVFDGAYPLLDSLAHPEISPPRAGPLVVGHLHDAGAWGDLPPGRRDLDGRHRRPIVRCALHMGSVSSGDRASDPFQGVLPGESAWACGSLAPLFVLWANVDESFLFGLVILAASAVGYLLDRGRLDVLLERPGRDG